MPATAAPLWPRRGVRQRRALDKSRRIRHARYIAAAADWEHEDVQAAGTFGDVSDDYAVGADMQAFDCLLEAYRYLIR